MGLMQSNKMQWGQERHQPFMGDPMAGAWQISRSFPGKEGEGNPGGENSVSHQGVFMET